MQQERLRYSMRCEVEKSTGYCRCAETGQVVPIESRERHHIGKRQGMWVHVYAFITPGLHNWIEKHTNKARELGWIRNAAYGLVPNPNQPRPWKQGTLVGEEILNELESQPNS
jgi:hypothetical protein